MSVDENCDCFVPTLDSDTSKLVQESICQEAHRLVSTDRGKDYGHPFDDFTKTAALWSPILGVEVTPEQVALCMIQVKVSRLLNSPDHHDSIVDIPGYAQTYDMVRKERERRASQ